MATARRGKPTQSLRTNGWAGGIPRPSGTVAAECSSRGTEFGLSADSGIGCRQASQSLYGANFGNSFLHCSELIGYSHFLAWNALMTPRSQRTKAASSKTQATRK